MRPLIHGTTYFAELHERIEATDAGDFIVFADWQGDADERLTGEPGSEVLAVLGRAAARGVDVRGLVWHSRAAAVADAEGDNAEFGARLRALGVEAWLDMRVRTRGSHHQKLVVLRHRDDSTRDVAFVGGIDLCHSRRDDATHGGDPQSDGMAEEYGAPPPPPPRGMTFRPRSPVRQCTMWRQCSGSAGRIRLRWTAALVAGGDCGGAAHLPPRVRCRARCRHNPLRRLVSPVVRTWYSC